MNSIKAIGCFVILGMLFAGTSAQAQNRYFSDAATGLLIQFIGAKSEGVSALGGAATLTLDGRFDIGFSYASAESDGRLAIQSHDYTPRLGVALTRPDSTSQWGIDLWGTYTWSKFRGEFADQFGGTAWVVGTDISLHLKESEGTRFIPTIGFGFGTIDSWNEYQGGSRYEQSREEFLLGLECSLYFNDLVVLAPQVTFFNGSTTWGITLGLAINGGPTGH